MKVPSSKPTHQGAASQQTAQRTSSPNQILQLQKTYGNRATIQMLKAALPIQMEKQKRDKNKAKTKPKRPNGINKPKEMFKTRIKIKATDAEYKIVMNHIAQLNSHVDWRRTANDIDAHLQHVLQNLDPTNEEDQAEIAKLQEYFDQTQAAVTRLETIIDGLATKYANYVAQSGPKGRSTRRSKNVLFDVDQLLNAHLPVLQEIKTNLNEEYSLNEGGFSAKGRAHAIDATSQAGEDDFTEDKRWLQDIQIGGTSLGAQSVYKNGPKVNDGTSNPVTKNLVVNYSNAQSRENALKKLETWITPLDADFSADWKVTPPSMGRGKGQESNMGGANATAYAMLAGINTGNTKWEWLHVRAASLGGETTGKNLVVGTRDVNTQMMPIESNLRLLAGVAQKYKNLYKHLHVDFSTSGARDPAGHYVDEINISWHLVKQPGADAKETSGNAKFKPIDSTTSISKFEIDKIQESLKEERTRIRPVEKMELE